MAKTFLTPINLNQFELQNPRIQNLATAPASPVEGQLYYDSDVGDKKVYFWNGSAWRSMDAAGSAGGYATIQEEGSNLTARATLNFVGGGFTAADDAGNTRTNVTLDATLNALAAYNTNGILVQTAADTFAGRTITGTAGQVSVSNGDGVAGNPTLSLPGTITQAETFSSTSGLTVDPGTGANTGLLTLTGRVVTTNAAVTTTLTSPSTAAGIFVIDTAATGGISLRVGATPQLTLVGGQLVPGQAAGANAGAPAYSFTGDPNTGIYSSAADTLNFSTGGSNRLQIGTSTIDVSTMRITGLTDPTSAQDAATKAYVDAMSAGLATKAPVIAATTGSETFTIAGGAVTQIAGTTLDGQSPAVNDRILVKDAPAATGAGSANSNQPANGIYIVTNATTNLTVSRVTDMDAWAEVPSAYVWVEKGTVAADTAWVVTSDPGGSINSTAIKWVLFSSATALIAGAGLNKTGNTIDLVVTGTGITVNPDDIALDATLQALAAYNTNGLLVQTAADTFAGRTLTGTANRIAITNGNGVSGNPTVDIDAAYVGQTTITTLGTITTGTWTGTTIAIGNGGTGQTTAKAARETGLGAAGYYSSATHGAGTSISITQATHGLRSSRGIVVQTLIESTGEIVEADYVVASNGDVTVTFAASQSANTIRVTLIG